MNEHIYAIDYNCKDCHLGGVRQIQANKNALITKLEARIKELERENAELRARFQFQAPLV